VLLLPYVTTLDVKVVRLIEKFVRAGGAVLALGVLPQNSLRREDDPVVKSAMKKIFNRQKRAIFLPWGKCGPTEIEKAMKSLDRLIGVPDIQLEGPKSLVGDSIEWSDKIHDPYLHENLEDILKKKKGGVCAYHYHKGGEDLYFIASLLPQKITFKAALRSRASRVELRYPATGKSELAKVLQVKNGVTTVSITLPPLESVIMAFTD
jgi:hypothetical protein